MNIQEFGKGGGDGPGGGSSKQPGKPSGKNPHQ